jgi:EpsI family protein
MIGRRDFLYLGGCVAALGGAEYFRPRTMVRLLAGDDLEGAIPRNVANWAAAPDDGIVVPTTPGSLADRLYSATVTRSYRRDAGDNPVMLLVAYGASQSDLLQLHRPESCYPAVGFAITHHAFTDVALPGAKAVPAVELTARSGGRVEDIVYWTRLGEHLPRSAGEQRRDRLDAAMQGYVGDGILVRASIVRRGDQPEFGYLRNFLGALVQAAPEAKQAGLVGTVRANMLRG